MRKIYIHVISTLPESGQWIVRLVRQRLLPDAFPIAFTFVVVVGCVVFTPDLEAPLSQGHEFETPREDDAKWSWDLQG